MVGMRRKERETCKKKQTEKKKKTRNALLFSDRSTVVPSFQSPSPNDAFSIIVSLNFSAQTHKQNNS